MHDWMKHILKIYGYKSVAGKKSTNASCPSTFLGCISRERLKHTQRKNRTRRTERDQNNKNVERNRKYTQAVAVEIHPIDPLIAHVHTH